MAISSERLAELQRLIQQDPEDLSAEQIVEILNRGRDEAQQFISDGSRELRDIPDSVFKRFDRDDIVPNRRQFITQGAWTRGVGLLRRDNMVLSECQLGETSSRYFFEVWDRNPDEVDSSVTNDPSVTITTEQEAARIQFAVSYGHIDGRGAPLISNQTPNSTEPTKATYKQYRNILLPPEQDKFIFKEEGDGTKDFYVINIARERYKQLFDPGNWELRLRIFPNNEFPENGDIADEAYSEISLVDEAVLTDFVNEDLQTGQLRRSYKIVSGSLNIDDPLGANPVVISSEENLLKSDTGFYGWFYPNQGMIVLNPKALAEHADRVYQKGPDWVPVEENGEIIGYEYEEDLTNYPNGLPKPENDDSSGVPQRHIEDDDPVEIEARIDAIKPETRPIPQILDEDYGGDIELAQEDFPDWPFLRNHRKIYEGVRNGNFFLGRSVEEIVSTHYFVRVRNRDFNFSNNPTFADEDGEFTNEDFLNDPKVFITTVGMYDNNFDLVSVAKLSRPVQKDFQREALIKVKLDF